MAEDDKRDSIDKFLDLAPAAPKQEILPAVRENTLPVTHVQDDYEYTRDTLRDVLAEGMMLFKEAAEAAKAGGQPEQFSVAASVMKGVVDAGDKLLGLSEKHQKVTGAGAPKGDIINNKLTVKLTSSELLDMILEAKKKTNGS